MADDAARIAENVAQLRRRIADAAARSGRAADAVTLCLLRAGDGGPFGTAEGLDSNHFAQVHQATGMIQVQLGVPTEDAFLLLRARAFASGRPVIDIARDVVERRLRFSEED